MEHPSGSNPEIKRLSAELEEIDGKIAKLSTPAALAKWLKLRGDKLQAAIIAKDALYDERSDILIKIGKRLESGFGIPKLDGQINSASRFIGWLDNRTEAMLFLAGDNVGMNQEAIGEAEKKALEFHKHSKLPIPPAPPASLTSPAQAKRYIAELREWCAVKVPAKIVTVPLEPEWSAVLTKKVMARKMSMTIKALNDGIKKGDYIIAPKPGRQSFRIDCSKMTADMTSRLSTAK